MRDFCTKCFFNCLYSLFLIGYNIIFKIFKLFKRRKPIIISQILAILLGFAIFYILSTVPISIFILLYVTAAIIIGIRRTWLVDEYYEYKYKEAKNIFYEQQTAEFYEKIGQKQKREESEEYEKVNEESKEKPSKSFENNVFYGLPMDEAKKLYHNMLKSAHPDSGGNEEATKRITLLWEEYCNFTK